MHFERRAATEWISDKEPIAVWTEIHSEMLGHVGHDKFFIAFILFGEQLVQFEKVVVLAIIGFSVKG